MQVFIRHSGSFFPCADVLSSCGDFFGSHAPRAFPFFSLPPFRRVGFFFFFGGGGGCPSVASRGLPLLPLDFCPAGGVEEPLDARSVHASSLLSPRFIRGLGRQELLSCGGLLLPFSVQVGSPSSSLHALQGDGAGESSGAFSVLGCLSCLISAHSARWGVFRVPLQLGFLPGFPIFGLGSREGDLSPLLVGWLS